ncbi:tRNA epoxyqueuosine(34) reductase QueG [Draconibacterium sp. IB214405]|uniref:tRNA epoxyqueuosine(34) reductase QueG n=1 Tax=Draconibacterium sp. IB214405 TaxID=3097352 RepID=UPI002A1035A2|nr:tRNA epoxyqueuosine(34) reductase QueG [Draconibacterium sp. IB214405]MDX8338467.1 tRNA epoxyqueuosine(34) reductase QueG [Draconibacterium sp. IB214405]
MLKQLKEKIQALGFLDHAFLPVSFLQEDEPRLKEWLTKDMHGEMGYMNRNIDKRLDPSLLVENAKTIIVVLLNYFPESAQKDSSAPVLSKYAYGTDYHFVMKDKLKELLQFIQEEIAPCSGRPFVDSAPVLERAWARKAGLGWVGKNSNLISPEYGSFFFIGELIIDIELPYDDPKLVRDHCGRCTKCIDSCPTKAIIADRVVDARNCISYQTIEVRGEMDANLKGQFENRVFGCDICQDVCPWNLKSEPHNEAGFKPHPKLLSLQKEEWKNLERPLFNELFKNSAVKRTGYKGLQRNLRFLSETDDEPR